MSIDTYFATQDPQVFEVHDKLVQQLDQWKADMAELIKPWGFDDCRAHAFKAPTEFLVKTTGEHKQGPVLVGFKGGSLVHGNGGPFFKYTVHGRHGREFNKALNELADKHRQPEQADNFGWAINTFKQILCKRLDVFSRVISGPYLNSTQCHVLTYAGGVREVILSVPVDEDDEDGYVVPKLADVWTEIKGSQYALCLNRHNARIRTAKSDVGVDDESF